MTFFPAIPWWLCLVLAVVSYVLAHVFERFEQRELGGTFNPVAAGISRLLVLTFLIIGIINFVQRFR
ncbi:MAG: hypothetical protein HYX26_09050 [Acidobacteriales bacterium]|nr:hypothetical protein [Terriglobales bacterium]